MTDDLYIQLKNAIINNFSLSKEEKINIYNKAKKMHEKDLILLIKTFNAKTDEERNDIRKNIPRRRIELWDNVNIKLKEGYNSIYKKIQKKLAIEMTKKLKKIYLHN